MADLLPVDMQPVGRPSQYTSNAVARQVDERGAAVHRDADRLDLSPEAERYAELALRSTVRDALIQRIRAEIEAGTYETDEKINVAIEQLAEDL